MKKNLLIAALLASILLSACSAGAVRPSPTVIAPTLIQTREMATDTPSPTLTSAPTPTPTPIPKPTPTSSPTPESTETATPTPTPTERPVPKEVTRIPGLTLRFNAEKGYWQYLDSDGRPVAHFSQTEHGKRIEIDVDNLDFEKHPELRGLFEPATSTQLARFEKEAIKNDPWVFILPVPVSEIKKLSRIIIKSPSGNYYLIGIVFTNSKNHSTIIYSPASGKTNQGRLRWSKDDWISTFKANISNRGKNASIFVGTTDGNLESLLKVPTGAKEWRQIGQPIAQATRPDLPIPYFTHSPTLVRGRGKYQLVVFPSSSNMELGAEIRNKGTYSHILRDPKTGKLLSIEAGKKSSRRESNRRLASRQRKLAEARIKAAITSAKARENWN